MIRLEKTTTGPSVLTAQKATSLKGIHASERANSVSPLTKFNRDVYGAVTVRRQIYKDQERKCCYCEKSIERAFNDVEHFRPKGNVRENNAHPGYWWLAYEWRNLLYSCPQCNRTGKSDKFPLIHENNRAHLPTDNIDAESPYLLNPYFEEVEHFFDYEFGQGWVRIIPSEDDLEGRAKKSIEVFDLNREDLRENRNGVFESFQLILNTLLAIYQDADQLKREKIKAQIAKLLDGATHFSGMLRYYLKLIQNEAGVQLV